MASGSFQVKHTSIYYYLPFDVRVPSTSKQLKKDKQQRMSTGSRLRMRIHENGHYQFDLLELSKNVISVTENFAKNFLRNLPKILMKKILETHFKILRIHFNKETAIPELFLNRVTNPSHNSNSQKN